MSCSFSLRFQSIPLIVYAETETANLSRGLNKYSLIFKCNVKDIYLSMHVLIYVLERFKRHR